MRIVTCPRKRVVDFYSVLPYLPRRSLLSIACEQRSSASPLCFSCLGSQGMSPDNAEGWILSMHNGAQPSSSPPSSRSGSR